MDNCEIGLDTNSYSAPKIDYDSWYKIKLNKMINIIDNKLKSYNKPTVIILEIGHFSLPRNNSNLTWAYDNVSFANKLCAEIIKKHKFKYKIIPTLLINNLENDGDNNYQDIIDDMLKGKKYINPKSLKIISERNLKNRAFKALKNDRTLVESFIHIDGKAYLKDDEYQHDLAAGFVNDDGDIIPRCGLILTSFLELVSKLAKERLHQNREINILFISFSQEFHEYKRVMLGVDIYDKNSSDISIDPMIFHWAYIKDQALLSHKKDQKSWESLQI